MEVEVELEKAQQYVGHGWNMSYVIRLDESNHILAQCIQME